MANPAADDDQWTRLPLAPCHTLKWIGGYLIFALVSGILLNGFVLYALLKKQHAQSPISIYMITLTFADLMCAILGIPLPLTSNLACRYLTDLRLRPVFTGCFSSFLGGCMGSTFVITKVS